jgi:hypothetical protein
VSGLMPFVMVMESGHQNPIINGITGNNVHSKNRCVLGWSEYR